MLRKIDDEAFAEMKTTDTNSPYGRVTFMHLESGQRLEGAAVRALEGLLWLRDRLNGEIEHFLGEKGCMYEYEVAPKAGRRGSGRKAYGIKKDARRDDVRFSLSSLRTGLRGSLADDIVDACSEGIIQTEFMDRLAFLRESFK